MKYKLDLADLAIITALLVTVITVVVFISKMPPNGPQKNKTYTIQCKDMEYKEKTEVEYCEVNKNNVKIITFEKIEQQLSPSTQCMCEIQ